MPQGLPFVARPPKEGFDAYGRPIPPPAPEGKSFVDTSAPSLTRIRFRLRRMGKTDSRPEWAVSDDAASGDAFSGDVA